MSIQDINRSLTTLFEMFQDRGYNLEGVDKYNIFNLIEKEGIKPIMEIKLMNKIKIVYYLPKFRWNDIKQYFDDDFELYILVLQSELTQSNMKQINGSLKFEVHLLKKLQFNITKHILVPKHEIIRDPKVKEEIKQMYMLKSTSQIPIILKTDPVAKYYGIKSGDLVKITRPSETAGEYIMYRCCL